MSARNEEAGTIMTELVIVMPVVLTFVLLAVQLGLWLHGRHVAVAAAQEGVTAAQVLDGTEDAGRQRAEAFLAEAGGVRDVSIQATRTELTARVEVRGTAPVVLPGLRLPLGGSAEAPVERWIAEPDR